MNGGALYLSYDVVLILWRVCSWYIHIFLAYLRIGSTASLISTEYFLLGVTSDYSCENPGILACFYNETGCARAGSYIMLLRVELMEDVLPL